ncbi:MAG: hypothetical protein SFU84_04490 [Gemmatimonadales bacterium]|nr:hypothetical protein [Gemmatimonadales bacterium]
MRHLSSLLLLALFGCATDLVTPNAPVLAQSLRLTPDSTAVDTAATLQFVTAVVWSDASQRPATVSWSASGGEISDAGLFRAGPMPGTFQVIASCSCGVSDTATVTVRVASTEPGPGPAPSPARLTVAVAGLPAGTPAPIVVNGPNGFSRPAPANAVLDSLAPGSYEVRASGATILPFAYLPVVAVQTIAVSAGGTATVSVEYRQGDLAGMRPHPRVWMTPERIRHLETQAAANSIRWSRVKAAADGQLGRGTSYDVVDLDKVPDLCLVYLATRDARYATRAGVILTGYAVEANNLIGDSGYGIRFNVPLVTMGLDWCYDGLTVAQRQQAATWLMNRADWTWPETNPARTGGYGTNQVDNNYFWGFMMTGPAALAAAGDDLGTGTISGSDRPTYHRQVALARWNSQAVPFFQGGGVGGAWAEGTNYESSWRVGSFADGFMTAGLPVSTPFLEASLRWRLHSTMPNGQHKVPFGDQPRVSDASLFTYDRLAALYNIAPSNAGGTLKSQVYHWLDRIGQVPTTEFNATAPLADELLRYDPAEVAAADLSSLPKHYHATGAGFFVYRTSWTDPNATVMAFESGPTSDHGARNANGLMIWKGGFWITATSNIYSRSGIEGATSNYNNLTIGGVGQQLYGGNGGTITMAPQVSEDLVAIRGQAKNGYGYQNQWVNTRSVTDYLRTVAYLPQEDAFVIVDRATINNGALAKVWRWHVKDQPQISGNTFRLQNPSASARCYGTVLSPGDVVLGTDSYVLGNGAGVTSHAVTVSMAGRATDVVVTVLQCTNAGSPPPAPTATVTATEATVTIGGRRVVVALSETEAVRLQ